MTSKHHVLNHLNAVGPQTEQQLVSWVTIQLADSPEDAKKIIASDGRIYSYLEDGTTYFTTRSQDPR